MGVPPAVFEIGTSNRATIYEWLASGMKCLQECELMIVFIWHITRNKPRPLRVHVNPEIVFVAHRAYKNLGILGIEIPGYVLGLA